MATLQSKKRLALAIIDFLGACQRDGSVATEDAESLEVAANCVADAFKVDASDATAMKEAVGAQNLLAVYTVYERMKAKSGSGMPGGSSAAEATPASSASGAGAAQGGNGKTKEEAEQCKGLGNAAMQSKDYQAAIDHYTQALDVVPLDPIYLSNRAAAYSGLGNHAEAKNDAELAVAADPKYSKAWSRLGLAKFVLGDARGAMEAYKAGMECEGGGGSEVMKRGYETARKKVEEEEQAQGGGAEAREDPAASRAAANTGAGGMPDLSSLAGMLGGGAGGAGGAGGGMPDLSTLMNNPMLQQMAQNVMQNPEMLNGMMSDPRVRQMAERFGVGGGGASASGGASGQGGGTPDLSEMMKDPNIADMARNFMGGAGRGRGS